MKVSRITELENEVEELTSGREKADKRIAELGSQLKDKEVENRQIRQQKTASVWKKVKVQARKAEEVHNYLSVSSSSQTAVAKFYSLYCTFCYLLFDVW